MVAVERNRLSVHLRWMIRGDWDAVLEIEKQSFEFPWTRDDLTECLNQRNCIGYVAEHGNEVVGFMLYELHNKKFRILDLAVRSDLRRCGVGSQLVHHLVDKLTPERRNQVIAEVGEANFVAHQFFKSQQFLAIKTLRDYFENDEDAYVFRRHINLTVPNIQNRFTIT